MCQTSISRRINWVSSVDSANSASLEELQRKMEAYYLNGQYYDDIVPATKLWAQLDQEVIHRNILETVSGKKVLEVGCGRAEILATGQLRQEDYTGCDFSPELIKSNSARHPVARFVTLDNGRSLPFEDNSFEAVFSVFVLEHAVFPEDFLSETVRILRPGGSWLLLCPNFLGCDRMTSQRVGYSLGSGRVKLQKGRLLDALVTSYDQRVRIPQYCRLLKKRIGNAKGFYVNLTPVCFAEKVFKPDVDAVYVTYRKEIVQHLESQVHFHPLPADVSSLANERRLIYLSGSKYESL